MSSIVPLSILAAAVLQRPSSVGFLFEHGTATAWLSLILAAVGLGFDWATAPLARHVIGGLSSAMALALLVHGVAGDTPFVAAVDALVVAPALLPVLLALAAWRPQIWRRRQNLVGMLVTVIVLGALMGAGLGFLGALGTMR